MKCASITRAVNRFSNAEQKDIKNHNFKRHSSVKTSVLHGHKKSNLSKHCAHMKWMLHAFRWCLCTWLVVVLKDLCVCIYVGVVVGSSCIWYEFRRFRARQLCGLTSKSIGKDCMEIIIGVYIFCAFFFAVVVFVWIFVCLFVCLEWFFWGVLVVVMVMNLFLMFWFCNLSHW